MSTAATPRVPDPAPEAPLGWLPPDHLDLPETDGSIVENFFENPQGNLLTDSIWPVVKKLHPDGRFCVGQDSGIFYKPSVQALQYCKAPDWFYVPGATPTADGRYRRSYVLWYELLAPLLILEFASGNGEEERDQTPETGKFWVYERAIRAPYYGIFDVDRAGLEVHQLVKGRYARSQPNERGRFAIEPMGVELGVWQGAYRNVEMSWLRWWDAQGKLLPTSEERAERLAAQLRALGHEPEVE